MVRTHPKCGRRGLCLGGECGWESQDLPPSKGQVLFAELLAHMIQPRFVHEHHWRPGDVLMSDNRCSLHPVTEWDEAKYSRRLHRLILLDDRRPS